MAGCLGRTCFLLIIGLALFGCSEKNVRWPDNHYQVAEIPPDVKAELIALITDKYSSELSNQELEAIHYEQTPEEWGGNREAFFTFKPVYESDNVKHQHVVDCSQIRILGDRPWQCDHAFARLVEYPRDNSWVAVVGDNLSDEEALKFLGKLAEADVISVTLGKNIKARELEISSLQRVDEGSIYADIFDYRQGVGIAMFVWDFDDSTPSVATVIEKHFECVTDSGRRVEHRFPCDFDREQALSSIGM